MSIDSAARTALARIAANGPVLPQGITPPGPSRDGPGPDLPGADGAVEPKQLEPVFDHDARCDIQGNIVPGFNKDHQHFLFFAIRGRRKARRCVAALAPMITSMDRALTFVREHRARRLAEGVREPEGCTSTWLNIAFSHAGVQRLAGQQAGLFGEQSFRQGLAARSEYLGDPTSPQHPGHREHWRVGGPGNEADILVIVAADRDEDLREQVVAIKELTSDLELLFEQDAHALPENLAGHEHFGFKDGVSQPGVRGRLSDAPDDFITPRYLDPASSGEGAWAELFGKPGQLLVWPGQFLLGAPRHSPQDLLAPDRPSTLATFPGWARHGSYLVCRRLRQDVEAFWEFAERSAARVGTDKIHFASLLVGRWPSGAPMMRGGDDDKLAGDEFANNHFIYDDDTRAVRLLPSSGYLGDVFPPARGDVFGNVCPHFAHIRKTNPRDIATEMGKPQDSVIRMIIRRGIPYGEPLLTTSPTDAPGAPDSDRGLMFLCYGASIEDQFEFLTRRWASSDKQPNPDGHDPIIGQRDSRGNGERYIEVATGGPTEHIRIERDFVVPTGGGYFFAPPISALTGVLGGG